MLRAAREPAIVRGRSRNQRAHAPRSISMSSHGISFLSIWFALAATIGCAAGSTPEDGAAPATTGAAGPGSKAAPTLFVRAKRLITRPGTVIEDAQVIVRDGKIAAVGRELAAPEGAQEISGEVVCASFLDPWGALGLAHDALVDGSTSAATRTIDALDLHGDEHLREETLRSGVTCARLQAGNSARVGGVGLIARLAPDLVNEEAVILADSNVSMSVGLTGQVQVGQGGDQEQFQLQGAPRTTDPFDRIAEIDRLIAAIEGGRNYLQSQVEYKHELEAWEKAIAEKQTELDKDFKKAKKDREKEQKDSEEKGKEFKEKKYKEDKKPQAPRYDEDSEVMARVANGELPLIVQAHRAAEIRALLVGTAQFDRLRLILAGGTEALTSAKELAERGIAVLIWPALRGKGAPDEYEGSDLELAARLDREGVEVLLGTGGAQAGASRDLPLLAELTVGQGFAKDKAFEALTLGAARAFDVADRIGSIERGKDAELLVLDGEPLEAATRVRYVISGGRVVLTPKDD
jgi:imidazolonepropionase-like amidohydrolase